MRALKKKPIQIYIEPRQDKVLDTLSKKKAFQRLRLSEKALKDI